MYKKKIQITLIENGFQLGLYDDDQHHYNIFIYDFIDRTQHMALFKIHDKLIEYFGIDANKIEGL